MSTSHLVAISSSSLMHLSGDSSSSTEMEVWSFNLRNEYANDGPDSWPERRAGVAELILQNKPAVICTQEATPGMLNDVIELLGALGSEEYTFLGNPRSAHPNDETAGILYNHEQLVLEQHETRWLNEPGSIHEPGWDAEFPRTLEMATFEVVSEPNHRLRVLNTHFDHVGVQARVESAKLIAEKVKEGWRTDPDLVQIVCGDFNSSKETSPFYQRMISQSVGLRDAARTAESVGEMPPFTIHKFEGLDFESDKGDGTVDLATTGDEADAGHIDWVLWLGAKTSELQPLHYEVVTDTLPSGRYPSDHFPVRFRFQLTEAAEQHSN